MEECLHIARAAALVGLHPETLRRLNKRGLLPAKRDWRGFRVFLIDDLQRLKAQRARLREDCVD